MGAECLGSDDVANAVAYEEDGRNGRLFSVPGEIDELSDSKNTRIVVKGTYPATLLEMRDITADSPAGSAEVR